MVTTLTAMSTPRFLKTIAVLAASAMLTVACSSSDDTDSLTLYSGRSEDLIGPLVEQFTADTGIDVEVKYLGSAEAALLIAEEGDRTPADVVISQSPGAMGFLEAGGQLAELDEDLLGLVAPSVRDDDGRWVGLSGRQRVLVYNEDLVAAGSLPDSVFDLTDPAWSGQVGVAPANGSFQDFVTAMRGEVGDDATLQWLIGLRENGAVTYPKNSAIVAAVGRGEVQVGLVNHYYNFRALDEDPSLPSRNHQLAEDDPGSVLIVTAASIISGNESDAATSFVEFLLSAESQRYFADETFEYPLAADVEPADGIPTASFAAVGDDTLGDLGDELSATRDLIVQAGFEG